jgi:hypothetical protein
MADIPDDNTAWNAFFTYVRRRADRIVPDTAREQEAERLTLEQIQKGELEFRWQDVDGREYVGLPPGFGSLFICYDFFLNAIRESPFSNARTLYHPQVRERQRKLNKPTDEAVAPAELAKHDEPDSHDERDEPVKPDEPTDQWPWRKDPALRADDGTEPRQIQLECEQKLTPLIRHDSDAKIRKALEKEGVSASDSSIRRAFGRK